MTFLPATFLKLKTKMQNYVQADIDIVFVKFVKWEWKLT